MVGLAAIGYAALAVAAFAGLVIWLVGRRRESNRMVSGGFGTLMMAILVAVAWNIYLGNLRNYITDVSYRADYVRRKAAAERRRAAYLKRKPNLEIMDFGILKDEERAKRIARLYGWDWKQLAPPPKGPAPK